MQVSPDLRRHVVFAHHNLLKDAPFTRLDLVSCRNILIYLSPAMQRKALASFHFALKTAACCCWGRASRPGSSAMNSRSSTRAGSCSASCATCALSADVRTCPPAQFDTGAATGWIYRRPAEDARVIALPRAADRAIRSAVLLVDDELKLLHASTAPASFCTQGRPPVPQCARSRRRRAARGAVGVDPARAARSRAGQPRRHRRRHGEGAPAGAGWWFGRSRGSGRGDDAVVIAVRAERGRARVRRLRPRPRLRARRPDDGAVSRRSRASCAYAKENLQATIEEMETSNEELQATNEELIASNEELQSTNEELHSVNEELYTVNAEYQTKIAELTELTADMNHLLEATEVHTLFVDQRAAAAQVHAQDRRGVPPAAPGRGAAAGFLRARPRGRPPAARPGEDAGLGGDDRTRGARSRRQRVFPAHPALSPRRARSTASCSR